MLYILKDIRARLEQIEICIEELNDKILENDAEVDQLKEDLYIKGNAQRQETDD